MFPVFLQSGIALVAVKRFCAARGSAVLSGDMVDRLVSFAFGTEAGEHRGRVSRLVSSTWVIYCPAAFEVGQAEFTSLGHFVISRPRLQPCRGPSLSSTGYRKYLSHIAPGYCLDVRLALQIAAWAIPLIVCIMNVLRHFIADNEQISQWWI